MIHYIAAPNTILAVEKNPESIDSDLVKIRKKSDPSGTGTVNHGVKKC